MLGSPGMPGKPGSDVEGDCEGAESGGPGSVVIATVPSVLREQPTARPTQMSAAAVTRSWVLMFATIRAHARRSVGIVPADELESAESTLAVLQNVLQQIADDDWSRQTPCREFDISGLTDHLMNSITVIGGAAGAELPDRDPTDSIERQVVAAARPALDAWHRRGLDGMGKFGDGEAPARMMAGILSLEFLVHAWDYATAMGQAVGAPDSLADYVMGVAQTVITPDGRSRAGFDDPIDLPADADSLDKLVAYTGRNPSG